MPEHRVKFNVPFRDLGRSDVKFKVYTGKRKERRLLGTLLVSHGAIVWRPNKARERGTVTKDWHEFDRLMTNSKR
ncbi:MAG: hypothetical protein ACRD2R_07825 [Terriglobales bacterium]